MCNTIPIILTLELCYWSNHWLVLAYSEYIYNLHIHKWLCIADIGYISWIIHTHKTVVYMSLCTIFFSVLLDRSRVKFWRLSCKPVFEFRLPTCFSGTISRCQPNNPIRGIVYASAGKPCDACSKLDHHCSDAGLVPNRHPLLHYLNQLWRIIDWTTRNKIQWNLNQIITLAFQKMHLKISSAKWWSYCFGLRVLLMHANFT